MSELPTHLDDQFDNALAVVGMAGRFPGAPSVAEFWRNVCAGVESVTFFSPEELAAAGVPESVYSHPSYVPAKARLDGVELFDAEFFGFNAHEAEMTDPQHRLFLECAWEALEDAAYDPARFPGRIGVYAGSSVNSYLLRAVAADPTLISDMSALMANEKDFLATRVAYKFDLRGPAMTIQSACSTSLVAIHQACQALLAGECDMALAGGVGVRAEEAEGYRHQDGMALSPDGHCRAFDRAAAGTVNGSGLAVVVLRRLVDAVAAGDVVHAVVRGSAVNNDGGGKAGFTAPSAVGQAQVVADALAVAGVSASSVGFVEAHGTGTPLGDPIEVAGLTRAFRVDADGVGFCALGSVKTNVGHLDAAAGVAGFVKAVLAVREGVVPPTVHFREANPKLALESSPFFVNGELVSWPVVGVRRAGVSALGVGGTNAHVVLEQPPAVGSVSGGVRGWQVVVVSGRTPSALVEVGRRVGGVLAGGRVGLADVAYTLQVGRRHFERRRAVVCRDATQAAAALTGADPERLLTGRAGDLPPALVFLFPGGGSQYVGMGRQLHATEPVFAEHLDRCADLAAPRLGYDLREAVLAPDGDRRAAEILDTTAGRLTALFAVEYALAMLWQSWGVRPEAMLGHSSGEYVAACLAGVFDLADAIDTVALRGQLIDRLPGGAMLAVSLPEEELAARLGPELSIAAVNAPGQCTVSGLVEPVQELAGRLAADGVDFRRLHVQTLGHSVAMEPVLDEFRAHVAGLTLREPSLSYVSNVTGTWITPAEATDPDYWVRHLRGTVRFADGVRTLLAGSADRMLVEVGPGTVLGALVGANGDGAAPPVLPSVRHPRDSQPDQAFLLATLARLWESGVDVDWESFAAGQSCRRVSLPTYPFERRRYWIDVPEDGPVPVQDDSVALRRAPEPVDAGPTSLDVDLGSTLHQRPHLITEYVAPRDDLEESIAAAWRELLGFETVGVHDNFFALGGSSLLTTRLVTRLRERFAVDLPLEELFKAHTIAAQATIIRALQDTEPAPGSDGTPSSAADSAGPDGAAR
ncbi:beta-ketoacyl synthase N-terminal-like domain-containing protein [Micromonospora sp. NPDC002717]|uniref:type I polyketide synthase n=1 Tax=Micromonospora sp. NPDC002717 TaxID=3154424 RepID=UPI00331E7ABD